VGNGGLCSPGCGRGVCSGGSWWSFKVLGVLCVFVMKFLRRFWVFSVVVASSWHFTLFHEEDARSNNPQVFRIKIIKYLKLLQHVSDHRGSIIREPCTVLG